MTTTTKEINYTVEIIYKDKTVENYKRVFSVHQDKPGFVSLEMKKTSYHINIQEIRSIRVEYNADNS